MHEAFMTSPIGHAHDPQSSWWRRFGQSLGRLRSALAAEQRRRQGIRQLQGMDDRMLADIGLSRGQIEFAASRSDLSRNASIRRVP